ncbi:S1C family serine protease [Myxococcota bacterium]|nr:S1C family serine protease [Myxococcota bacterium]
MKRALAALGLGLALTSSAADAKPAKPRTFDSTQLEHLEAMVPVLRARVAELHAELVPDPNSPLEEPIREGYGVVLAPRLVATLSFSVTGAKRVLIHGPSGRPIVGKVVLDDVERRVAIVEAERPLSEAGLVVAELAPRADRKVDGEVFALVSTGLEATVLQGTFLTLGDEPEHEGHPRVDLKLTLGMPVFDARARFVGYSRAVAWDKDPLMLVTPEMIASARTATGAADRAKAHPPAPKKPWWAR